MWRLAGVLAVLLVGAAIFVLRADRTADTPRPVDPAAELAVLRLMATDLQRSVETMARSPDPDPAELSALAARLEALTRRLEVIEADRRD